MTAYDALRHCESARAGYEEAERANRSGNADHAFKRLQEAVVQLNEAVKILANRVE